MMYQVEHFINGHLVKKSTERKSAIYNPAIGEIIGEVNLADQSLLEQAVSAAKQAFVTWSITPLTKRVRILFRYRELLEANTEQLAKLVTQEHGKTLTDAYASIQRGIDVVNFACGMNEHLLGNYALNVAAGIDNYSLRQPLGVCVGITPFNFPAMIPLWMFPLAIVCGNTFILKPSEKNPSCAILLAELAHEAGVPPGVLNVIHGDVEVVNGLLHHPDISAVSFVGSTPVAKYVYQTAISQGKRAQTFGGAKNHCIVLPDVDLNSTADTIVGAAFGSAGERCMALSVAVIVDENNFADQLIKKMSEKIQQLKIGPGDEKNIDMGPLISAAHREKIITLINSGLNEGAKLIVDGRNFKLNDTTKGFYLGGSLFDYVDISMKIWQEEIFGPVLCVMRAPDFATALNWVNSHFYGNGSAIFTNNPAIARTFSLQVATGMVGVNVPIPVPIAAHSFGGWKQSRFGDLHLFGQEGVQFYTQLKTIMQRWSEVNLASSFNLPAH